MKDPVGSQARLSRVWCNALTPVLGGFRLCLKMSIEESEPWERLQKGCIGGDGVRVLIRSFV